MVPLYNFDPIIWNVLYFAGQSLLYRFFEDYFDFDKKEVSLINIVSLLLDHVGWSTIDTETRFLIALLNCSRNYMNYASRSSSPIVLSLFPSFHPSNCFPLGVRTHAHQARKSTLILCKSINGASTSVFYLGPSLAGSILADKYSAYVLADYPRWFSKLMPL